MRKIVFFLAFIAAQAFGLSAQEALSSFAPTEAENSLLWEISGKGLPKPSFLYGTIHMIAREDFFLTEPTKASFEKAERVTFEINMEEMSDFSVLMPLMMQAFMKNDTTLQDLLSTEEYTLVKNHFEKLGLPMMFLDRIKPMFLSALGSEDALAMQQTPGEVVSYEMEFMEMARKGNKQMAGLETAQYQMSVFDSIPYGIQAEMLVQTIQSGDAGDDQFEQLVKLYKDQDINGLQLVMQSEEAGVARYEDLLLVNRNRNWVPVMERMMKEKPTFFAVGAGHLPGESGVIALLRQQGYSVKPLR